MKINVCTCVTPMNFDYFPVLRENLLSMASSDVEFTFHAVIAVQHKMPKLRMSPDQLKWFTDNCINMIDGIQFGSASSGHAGCLMSYLKTLSQESDDYTLLTDLDVMIVKKNFDKLLKSVFDSGIDVFGYSNYYSPKRIADSDWDGLIRYLDVPALVWFVFKNSSAPWKMLDLTPQQHVQRAVKEESSLYHIPPNVSLYRDTGWKIPAFLREHNLKYSSTKTLKVCDDGLRILTASSYVNTFLPEESHYDDEPFLAHQCGSSRCPYKGSEYSGVSKIFYDQVEKYIIGLENSE